MCGCASEANPGFGDWGVTPRVHFAGTFTQLVNPERVPIVRADYVRWKPATYEDGLVDFYADGNPNGGGDQIFAEKGSYASNAMVHDHLTVSAKVIWPASVAAGWTATFYLKAFDPDHYSDLAGFDLSADPNDNIVAGANGVLDSSDDPANIGGNLAATTLTFNSPNNAQDTTFTISSRQPGNNFIVAAAGHPAFRNDYVFSDDAVTLISRGLNLPVPDAYKTKQLTVWRTLWVEEDSMGAPGESEVFSGAGGFNDDVNPMNLGTAVSGAVGTGSFAQPSLAFLTTEFTRANVAVATIVNGDGRDDATFVRNLNANNFYTSGNAVRDIWSSRDSWVIQMFGAYEYDVLNDFDWNPLVGEDIEDYDLGRAVDNTDGPAVIFLETIRDVVATLNNTASRDLIAQRSVLHETLHRFGLLHGANDEASFIPDNVVFGTQLNNAMTGIQLRSIITALGPTGST